METERCRAVYLCRESIETAELRTMPTAKQHRQQAEQSSELAKVATNLYAIQSLLEVVQEFHKAADQLERKASARRNA